MFPHPLSDHISLRWVVVLRRRFKKQMKENFENQFLELIAICKIRKAEGFRILHAKRTELFHVRKDRLNIHVLDFCLQLKSSNPCGQVVRKLLPISAQSGGNHP